MTLAEDYTLVRTLLSVHVIAFSCAIIAAENLTSFGAEGELKEEINLESLINGSSQLVNVSDVDSYGALAETNSTSSPGSNPWLETTSLIDDTKTIAHIGDNSSHVNITFTPKDAEIPIVTKALGYHVDATSANNVTASTNRLMGATVPQRTSSLGVVTNPTFDISPLRSSSAERTTETGRVSDTDMLTTQSYLQYNTDQNQLVEKEATTYQLDPSKTGTSMPLLETNPVSIDDHYVTDGVLDKKGFSSTTQNTPTYTQYDVHPRGLNVTSPSGSSPFSIIRTDSNSVEDTKENLTKHFNMIPVVAVTSVFTTLAETVALPVDDTQTGRPQPLQPPEGVHVTPIAGQPGGENSTVKANKPVRETVDSEQDDMTTMYNPLTSTKTTTTPVEISTPLTLAIGIPSPVVIKDQISAEFANISNTTETEALARDERLSTDYNPFVVVWNIPSRKCATSHGTLPKLSHYGIIHNKHQHFYGEQIVIFYANHLGFYPQILQNGEVVNGGVPQLANLDIHLAKVRTDIDKRIPNQNFSGYAVIDWEAWRPIFRRNWGVQRIYKKLSVRAVEKYYPTLKYRSIKAIVKKEFDKAARNFMETTLTFAKSLRPRAKWGFYLFPDCYNFREGQDYCHKKQMRRNDKLSWMFQASGALYPSIYLSQKMSVKYRAAHIKGILGEAYRIQETHTDKWSTPVLPYARLRYGDTDFLLSKDDLEGTIGQAATTGASGIILWERYVNTVGKRKCFQLEKYIRTILGPYLKIVQNFVVNCSKTLCKNNGRCVRKKHVFQRGRSREEQQRFASMLTEYKENYRKAFRCKCYQGWSGSRCGRYNDMQKV